MIASQLGVASQVGEVLYEGSAPRRKLEQLYTTALKLATPELLNSMGMGMGMDEQPDAAAGAVGLDQVEMLRAPLKIKEVSKARAPIARQSPHRAQCPTAPSRARPVRVPCAAHATRRYAHCVRCTGEGAEADPERAAG